MSIFAPKPLPPNLDIESAEAFIEKLARALHRYGTPAHRLEEALSAVAQKLGLEMQFFSAPTSIFASFSHRGRQSTQLMRVEPGEVNLEKLALLDEELDRVLKGSLDTDRASQRIDAVVDAPIRYGAGWTTLAFCCASATAARFFGGGGNEVVAAAGVGLLIGLLALFTEHLPAARRLFEALAAMVAAAVTTVAATATGQLSPSVVTLAGLIVLIPGLTLTTAMTELATRHLVSGGARLAGALLMFLTIGFGVALGGRLGITFAGEPPMVTPTALPAWTEGIALLVAAGSFTVLFRARPQHSGWILAAATLALFGGRAGAAFLGPELGALLGAILVGSGSNLYARLLNRPSAIIQVPGLMLLVPGSMGFRSIAALIEHDTVSGVQTAFAMSLVAIALVTGLLMANVIVPPRRIL